MNRYIESEYEGGPSGFASDLGAGNYPTAGELVKCLLALAVFMVVVIVLLPVGLVYFPARVIRELFRGRGGARP